VFTSVFLYDGWENAPVYFLLLVSYVAFSDVLQPGERRKRAHFTSVIVFATAILANILWLIAKPLTYSWGASGVVYALWGVLTAFTIIDGLPKYARSADPRTWYPNKKERDSAVGNLAIFSSTALFLILDPTQFISSGPGINSFVHAVSFLGGYLSIQVYRWRNRL
jgi:membrane associated rhomboid family serine protease